METSPSKTVPYLVKDNVTISLLLSFHTALHTHQTFSQNFNFHHDDTVVLLYNVRESNGITNTQMIPIKKRKPRREPSQQTVEKSWTLFMRMFFIEETQ